MQEVDASFGEDAQRRGVNGIELVVGDERRGRKPPSGLRERWLVADDTAGPPRPPSPPFAHARKLIRGFFLQSQTCMTNIDALVSGRNEVSGAVDSGGAHDVAADADMNTRIEVTASDHIRHTVGLRWIT